MRTPLRLKTFVLALLPAHAVASRYGSGWDCMSGFRRVSNTCVRISVPANAYLDPSGNAPNECLFDELVLRIWLGLRSGVPTRRRGVCRRQRSGEWLFDALRGRLGLRAGLPEREFGMRDGAGSRERSPGLFRQRLGLRPWFSQARTHLCG